MEMNLVYMHIFALMLQTYSKPNGYDHHCPKVNLNFEGYLRTKAQQHVTMKVIYPLFNTCCPVLFMRPSPLRIKDDTMFYICEILTLFAPIMFCQLSQWKYVYSGLSLVLYFD